MITRRSMLLGLGSALAASAIVRADSLMKLCVPKPVPLVIHSEAKRPAYIIRYQDGVSFQMSRDGKTWVDLESNIVPRTTLLESKVLPSGFNYVRLVYPTRHEAPVIWSPDEANHWPAFKRPIEWLRT